MLRKTVVHHGETVRVTGRNTSLVVASACVQPSLAADKRATDVPTAPDSLSYCYHLDLATAQHSNYPDRGSPVFKSRQHPDGLLGTIQEFSVSAFPCRIVHRVW
jgi:hypothetical protein